jgi:broad specificity phosphatase PhoE
MPKDTNTIDPTPSTIHLIRHGQRLDFVEPEWFDTAIYRYDPPLAASGHDRARSIASECQQLKIDRIVASPLLRAIQTALPSADRLSLPIQLEWGLCEWLCGEWTVNFPTVEPLEHTLDRYPQIDRHYSSQVMPVYPESESDLTARVARAIPKIIQFPARSIAIFGHKVSLLKMAALLTGDPTWSDYNLPCGGIISIEFTPSSDLFKTE